MKASLDIHFHNPPLMQRFIAVGDSLELWEDTEPILRRFVEFYPGNAPMVVAFARILAHLGKTREAQEHLETLLLFDAANDEARRVLDQLTEGPDHAV